MKDSHNKRAGRRHFLKTTAAAAGGLVIVPRYVLGGPGFTAPSDRLNIAAVGAGGKGTENLLRASGWDKNTGATRENIVALCDVDDRMAAESFGRYATAKRFKDFRIMLEQMHKDIDAVIVSTPDHNHAVAAMAAMQLGKHVYVEKPLTHDVYEARMLTEAARRYKVVSQMGNQGSSMDYVRDIEELIMAGAIGPVREVHAWTNRPVWPQSRFRPKETPKAPKSLDWNLWLGTAPDRPYHPWYHPFAWRGWWDFGTGALGDMACHILDPAFRALKLGYPSSVEASAAQFYVRDWTPASREDGIPNSSIIHFEFPARSGEMLPALKLSWYDGGLMPQRPEELEPHEPFGGGDGGVMFIGEKGKMTCEIFGRNYKLLPSSRMKDLKMPPQTLKRIVVDHQSNWVQACKGEAEATSSFDYAGPFSEMVLMGNLALRCLDVVEKVKAPDGNTVEMYTGRKKLLWDGPNMRITNYEPANQYVKRAYRKGWSL